MTRAFSGRPVDEVTLDGVRTGGVGIEDVRISAAQLVLQAETAEAHGNPQLGANLRRAAELTAVEDDEVLATYEALRPGRSSYEELTALAASFDGRGAARVAALLSEAAETYRRRGLLRP